MGIITSKNTRRISFDNTFTMTPVLIQKPIEDIDHKIAIDNFEKVLIYI